jgi:hypothetical protein
MLEYAYCTSKGHVVTSDQDPLITHRSRMRRKRNSACADLLLNMYSVNYDAKAGSTHLVIRHSDRVIDFWPGTGTWIDRANGVQRRGVFNLLRYIGVKKS